MAARMAARLAALFPDRAAAGQALARRLRHLKTASPLVLALPRGGVPVAAPIAAALGAPLDVLLVRKIGAPGNPEYGIGAMVEGTPPFVWIDEEAARAAGADPAWLAAETAREGRELARRRALYRPGPPPPVAGRTVIVVDDGIATGATMRVALQALAPAARRVLAVPVCPAETARALAPLCEESHILAEPCPFGAVGAHYADFRQVRDDEVRAALARAAADPA